MRFLLVILAIVGLATALPVENEHQVEALNSSPGARNTALEQLVLDIIEEVRGVMVTGTDVIPVLDPLNINKGRIEGRIMGNHAHIAVENLELKQLSSFVIDKLRITSFLLIRYTVEFGAHLPEIDMDTEVYDLEMTAAGFKVFGKGEAKAKIGGARVSATVVIAPRISTSGLFIQINSADIKVGLDTFQPTFTGFFGNEPANDFVNIFLESLVPELLEYFEDDISAIINSVVMEYGNQILADLDFGSIIGSINVQKIAKTIEDENPEMLGLPRRV